jgi:hypothetical protein
VGQLPKLSNDRRCQTHYLGMRATTHEYYLDSSRGPFPGNDFSNFCPSIRDSTSYNDLARKVKVGAYDKSARRCKPRLKPRPNGETTVRYGYAYSKYGNEGDTDAISIASCLAVTPKSEDSDGLGLSGAT